MKELLRVTGKPSGYYSIFWGVHSDNNNKMTVDYTSDEKAVAIAPKFSSLMSIFGSTFIVVDVLLRHIRKQQNKPSHRKSQLSTLQRLLVAMSLCDIATSTTFFFTTWPIPAFEDVYLASGTWNTCIAQGFLSQFSLAVVYYNLSLSAYYVIAIGFNWSPNRIRIRCEPLLHAAPLIIGLSTSIVALPLRLYNNDLWECWISPFPLDCKESWKYKAEEANCIRGDNASLYRWLFYYAFLWIAILLVTVNMIYVYYAVLKQEKLCYEYNQREKEQQELIIEQQMNAGDTTNDNSNEEDNEPEHRPGYDNNDEKQQLKVKRFEYSKKVAMQGYWFCGAFYLTWIFPTITRLVQVMNGSAPFNLVLVTAIFVPWQGFFNWLVYIMPRYQDYFDLMYGCCFCCNEFRICDRKKYPNDES